MPGTPSTTPLVQSSLLSETSVFFHPSALPKRNHQKYLGSLKTEYVVFKNDEVTIEQIEDAKPKGFLVSPGPGTPEESGISLETVEKLGPKFPLFGVCLGHQCIGQVFGGEFASVSFSLSLSVSFIFFFVSFLLTPFRVLAFVLFDQGT